MLAVVAYKAGDCETAVSHFAASEYLLDSQPAAMQEYGACLLKMKQTDKAIAIFRKLLDSQPDDARAVRRWQLFSYPRANRKDALTTLQPLLGADAEVATMRWPQHLRGQQDTPNAVKILRDAIVKDPQNTALYVDFAEIAMGHQSFQTGVEMIDAGLKLKPESADLYLARGVLYVQMAHIDKAEADFAKAEQLDPRQGLSAAAQGWSRKKRTRAIQTRPLQRSARSWRKNQRTISCGILQAAILSQKAPDPGSAEFQQGMKSAQKAMSLDPGLTSAHNVLAKFYLDAGQYAQAAKECRLVLGRQPADQTALYHLVMALRKTGGQSRNSRSAEATGQGAPGRRPRKKAKEPL